MNFVLGLLRLNKDKDFIFMIVDRFSKMKHVIVYYKINNITNISYFFFREIIQLHGFSKNIISNHDVKLVYYF